MDGFAIMTIGCAIMFLLYAAINRDIRFESVAWITIVVFAITILAGSVANQFFGVSTWIIAHFVTIGFLMMCVGCFLSGLRGFLAGEY